MSDIKDKTPTLQSTYYDILGLSDTVRLGSPISTKSLKLAYRRTLLQNHPDKSSISTSTHNKNFSIDQITQAFATLVNPVTRARYDKNLKIRHNSIVESEDRHNFFINEETVDLDDLESEESKGIWYRSCRCGDDRGFLIQEGDLEAAEEEGEIRVECRGCSLWLKVLFQVATDDQII